MSRHRHEDRQTRKRRFEQFEQRLVMSAQTIVDVDAIIGGDNLQPTTNETAEISVEQPPLVQHSSSSGDGSPTNIHADYGFDGTGQTVAIIDSGIAWDHIALGGGFGEDHRVVGGWDFAENDADPYDDGPAGFHGTHVAGIVGAVDDQYSGVAPGADLVGLRVFTDSGYGEIEWVEQALQWVHENKDNFENPITTVNLSLGMDWNSNNVPEWATLEDEFAQLKDDGIFISVAAGNAFQANQSVGVSYPAVSPYVVPVASHGADGEMSDFSQRNERVLVAPGEKIRSTAPDHLFTGGKTNGFTGTSGTSQATPYVAGASAILRQANEFMGVDGIDQDLLYQQFMDTANQIYDSVTNGYYHQVNLQAAIEAVVIDSHGEDFATATDAGTMGTGDRIEGTIGTRIDVDSFKFQAQHSGQMRFEITSTHDLSPLLKINNADYEVNGNVITFEVEAGQEYQFSMETADGIGHYNIDIELTQVVAAENLGVVSDSQFDNLQVNGTQWFQMQAGQSGLLTVQANWESNSNMTLAVFDANMNQIDSISSSDGSMRIDVAAAQGEAFFVKATGHDTNVDLRATNLVSLTGGVLTVDGTQADDVVKLQDEQNFQVEVNGVGYQFHSSLVESVVINGHGGQDRIDVNLGATNDKVSVGQSHLAIVNDHFQLTANGFADVNVNAGSGVDDATLFGTDGNDWLVSSFDGNISNVNFSSVDFHANLVGFDQTHVLASGGFDTATLNGTDGDEHFLSMDGRNALSNQYGKTIASGFDRIYVNGAGGKDLANINDSAGNDKFILSPTFAHVESDEYRIWAGGFERINAYSTSGSDELIMKDSMADDQFYSVNQRTAMYSDGYTNVAFGFTEISAVATIGNDVGHVRDTSGRDVFEIGENSFSMISTSKSVDLVGFDRTNAVSVNGGNDVAHLTGTDGNDGLYVDDNSTTLFQSDGTIRRVVGMRNVNVDMGAGNDASYLQGGMGDNQLKASKLRVEFESFVQRLTLQGAEDTTFVGGGGYDKVIFDDFDADSLLCAIDDEAHALLAESTVRACDIDFLKANTETGTESTYEIEAVDYLYMLKGDWNSK